MRARMRKEFPSRRFPLEQRSGLQPITTHYSIVGSAFDYVLRWHLQKRYAYAQEGGWVAENVAFLYSKEIEQKYGALMREQVGQIILEAREHHALYLESGVVTDALLQSALLLAQIDVFFRIARLYPPIYVDNGDVEDLR